MPARCKGRLANSMMRRFCVNDSHADDSYIWRRPSSRFWSSVHLRVSVRAYRSGYSARTEVSQTTQRVTHRQISTTSSHQHNSMAPTLERSRPAGSRARGPNRTPYERGRIVQASRTAVRSSPSPLNSITLHPPSLVQSTAPQPTAKTPNYLELAGHLRLHLAIYTSR